MDKDGWKKKGGKEKLRGNEVYMSHGKIASSLLKTKGAYKTKIKAAPRQRKDGLSCKTNL